MMSELVRSYSIYKSYLSVKSPRCCRKTQACRNVCLHMHTHSQPHTPPTESLLRACHEPRQPSPYRFPFLISNQMSSFPLVHPLPHSFNKSISWSQTPTLCVFQLKGVRVTSVLPLLLEHRLVHSSELPSSEAMGLGLAQSKLPFSLWVSLAGGAACHW